jgi:hypothetical protein
MSWQRIEGTNVAPDITEGITAAVADPLWMLARQWQAGEFRGEDAASPILIDADVIAAPLTEFWIETPAGRSTITRQEAPWPLETLVEREPITDGPAAVRIRLERGSALLRALAGAGAPNAVLDDFRTTYPYTGNLGSGIDPVGEAQLALLARRSPDAVLVTEALVAAGSDPLQIPPLTGLGDQLAGRLAAVVRAWNEANRELFCEPSANQPTAWDESRLEYRFGVTTHPPAARVELDAPEYPGGALDWFHFDIRGAASETAEPGGVVRKHLTSLPTPLEFAGMPAPRWWEFEDHDVDFGDMNGGPDDLARSTLAAYAMVAGDDWNVVPCELQAGTVSRVERLTVVDDYGGITPLRATAVNDAAAAPGARVWRFFELSGDGGPDGGRSPLLFLPPVVHAVEQSRAVEEVEFRRDEMANIGWAIERRVESSAGHAVDRQAPREPSTAPAPRPTDGAWRYQLATDVPDNWVPLVPVRIESSQPQIALRRGRLSAEPAEHQARGRILEPEHAFVVHEEEIPAGGLRVERRWQLARGADGQVRLWVGRRKAPGGGPLPRTPLRFDNLTGWPSRPS